MIGLAERFRVEFRSAQALDDASPDHEQGGVGQGGGLLDFVRDQKPALTLLAKILEATGQAFRSRHIQTGEGLVEEQQVGIVHSGPGDGQTLRHAPGESPGPSMGHLAETFFFKQFLGSEMRFRDAIQSSGKNQVFLGGELGIEQGGVAQIADGVSVMRLSPDFDLTLGGGCDSGGNAKEGALSRTVGPEQGEGFAGLQFKIDSPKGGDGAIGLLDSFELEKRRVHDERPSGTGVPQWEQNFHPLSMDRPQPEHVIFDGAFESPFLLTSTGAAARSSS